MLINVFDDFIVRKERITFENSNVDVIFTFDSSIYGVLEVNYYLKDKVPTLLSYDTFKDEKEAIDFYNRSIEILKR